MNLIYLQLNFVYQPQQRKQKINNSRESEKKLFGLKGNSNRRGPPPPPAHAHTVNSDHSYVDQNVLTLKVEKNLPLRMCLWADCSLLSYFMLFPHGARHHTLQMRNFSSIFASVSQYFGRNRLYSITKTFFVYNLLNSMKKCWKEAI